MSHLSSESPPDQKALRDEEFVYRLGRRAGFLNQEDKNRPFTPAAFLLDDDEEGLSVFPTETCSLKYAVQNILDRPHGVDSLQVGAIRAVRVEGLTLDVVRKEDQKHPGKHAEIVGLPHIKDDERRANRAAELLAKLSHSEWRRKDPIPDDEV